MKNKSVIFGLVLIVLIIVSFEEPFNFMEKSNAEINDASTSVVVLELYTSQGCSSCPSADALLEKVKNQYTDDVISLSYHVDYWNYIGWQDPFSKPEYAEKQTAYNYKFKNRTNYTPQLVVNGQAHFVGSSTTKMYEYISSFRKLKKVNNIEISNIKSHTNIINFNYLISGHITDKRLRAVLVINKRVTNVKRGENRNRTLTNSNIVVEEKYITPSKEGSNFIEIPKIVEANDKISLVIIVESKNYDITGAAKGVINR